MSRSHLFAPAAVLLVAWGVFAFGAEFTWAYTPLLVFALVVSVLGVMAAHRVRAARDGIFAMYRPLILSLALLFGAAAFQVAPLPAAVVASISPARNAVDYPKLYAKFDLDDYQADAPQQPARTLSIEPTRTTLGLAFLAVWSVLLVAAAAGFGAVRPTLFARGLVAIGVLAAFAELTQRNNPGPVLYGFFPLRQQSGAMSAPFINRNHTAGLLDMAVAVSLGYLMSCVAVGWRKVKPDWRSRLLWFSSAPAAEALLVTFALFVMATAVIATQSRSGLLCLALVVALFLVVVAGHQGSRTRRAVIVLAVAAVVAAAAGFGGVSAVIDRFVAEPIDQAGGRIEIWRFALAIIRDFPVVGSGLNTFGIAALHYQTQWTSDLYIEAHNDYLQLAAEGGALLCVPAVAAVVSLVVLIRRRFAAAAPQADDARVHWLRVGATIALCAMALQSCFDFTLQMAGGAAAFVLIAAIAIHRPWVSSRA